MLDLDGNPQPVVARTDSSRDGRHDRRRRVLVHPPDDDEPNCPSCKQGEYKLGTAEL